MWLWLLSCAPDPGEPGYVDCGPYQGGDDCVVWLCYEAIDYDRVKYWVEYGAEGRLVCDGSDCSEALQEATEEQCPATTACASDCCEVCAREVSQPCDGQCISADATCPQGPGCACWDDQACG